MIKDILVFSLSSSIELTDKVCAHLGIKRSEAEILHFADGEILATSKVDVRGKKVYVIQSTCSPVNDRLMETLIFIDGVRRANCREVTVVVPYFGYARQDRIAHVNEPITARMVADLYSKCGANRIITIELHTLQMQGFFSIPNDNLSAASLFARAIKSEVIDKQNLNPEDVSIVAPDHGAIYRARDLVNFLPDSSLIVVDKRRPKPNVAQIVNVVGEIKDKICIMIDDIIDTGGTICAGAQLLKERGAKKVYICATHALFSNNALARFEDNDNVDGVFVTDTVYHDKNVLDFSTSKKVKVVSIAEMIADVIESHESHVAIKDKFAMFH